MTHERKFFDASKRKPVPKRIDPVAHAHNQSATPLLFAVVVTLLVALYDWPRRWLLSGAPILTYILLLGASKSCRVLPIIPLWTLLATLHLAYAVAATSWLLYWVFLINCYPLIFLTCLFQFNTVARFVRKRLRMLLRQLHFVNEKIAFFDLPALEIDTTVDGLMVVRGLTISLSSLTVIAHGIEVGIKLSDDMELAIQVEHVKIPFFRRIEIGDVYANIKGGEYEMTFGNLEESTKDEDGDPIMATDTPLLRAATANGDADTIKMISKMTEGSSTPRDSSTKAGINSVTALSPDNDEANEFYQKTLDLIEETNSVRQARKRLSRVAATQDTDTTLDSSNDRDLRAAICSELHNKPSISHPPQRSIKVTTLQNLSPPWVRTLLHRLPMLLRLLLNPITYLHPVHISSITAAGSGRWISYILGEHIFQDYGQDAAEIRRLEQKITSWLSEANFVLQLADILGLAQSPFLPDSDINCQLKIDDVMAYRSLPASVELKQVTRLGGMNATFAIPAFLLPHHEHLLPAIPTRQDKEQMKIEVEVADGLPKTIQAQQSLEQAVKDETNVKMAVHASLPACFDQELLNFIAALVKATKVVEMEKEPSAMDREVSGIKDFSKNLSKGMKDGMKKAVVGGIVNDQWIAKLVAKVTKKLETAQGDMGYSGNLPVALGPYRLPEGHVELSKVLA